MENSTKGFTLVELAISLMIIGLLIGGVLKGQELIKNAENTALLRQLDSYKTAARIFYTTYKALPGDIRNPTSRVPSCTVGTPCDATGDGDGHLNNHIHTGSTGLNMQILMVDRSEPRGFFIHLQKAGMITGINADSASAGLTQFGQELPAIQSGDSNGVAIADYATPVWGALDERSNFLLVMNSDQNSLSVPPKTVALIDTKIDDGLPDTGNVRAMGNYFQTPATTGCAVTNSGSYIYDETKKDKICNLMVKLEVP